MSGLFSAFEVVEFVNCMRNVAHGFTRFCVHALTDAKELFPLYRATRPLKQKKIIVPGIVLLLLQKPWDELCPSWGCALRKSRTSESTCDSWIGSEGNENTWNQWLHLKEETVENRWDKAGHCSTETTDFCYWVPCRDNPYWKKPLAFTV